MQPALMRREAYHSPEMDYAGARKLAAYHTTVENLPTLHQGSVFSHGENQVVNF